MEETDEGKIYKKRRGMRTEGAVKRKRVDRKKSINCKLSNKISLAFRRVMGKLEIVMNASIGENA